MKARLAIALSFFLLPALLLFVNNSSRANGNPRPHAAHGCSAKTTVGRYFVICNGFLSPGPNAPLLPAKLLGTLNADDNGTFTGASTVMIGGGPPLTQTGVGTEHLKSGCNGTIHHDPKINGQQSPPPGLTRLASHVG